MPQDPRLLQLALKREVDRHSDGFFVQAEALGRDVAGARLKPAQVHNLEATAYSTDKLSDIWDFIKKQVGRRPEWSANDVGARLLNDLRGLNVTAGQVVTRLKAAKFDVPADTARQVHLELCREYIRHLASHYEYEQRRLNPAHEDADHA